MSVESPVEQSPVASLRLKTGADRRLRAGHLWIYSNEVNTDMTPLKGCLLYTSPSPRDS